MKNFVIFNSDFYVILCYNVGAYIKITAFLPEKEDCLCPIIMMSLLPEAVQQEQI